MSVHFGTARRIIAKTEYAVHREVRIADVVRYHILFVCSTTNAALLDFQSYVPQSIVVNNLQNAAKTLVVKHPKIVVVQKIVARKKKNVA